MKWKRGKKRPMDEQKTQKPDEDMTIDVTDQDQTAAQPQTEETPAAAPAVDPAELQAAKAKADEYLALAQRVQADFDNFRRRNEGVRADAFAEGQRKVATAMLPVLDNLERALASADQAEGDALKTGVEMTRKQMAAVYEKLGVTAIDRLGEKFDPNLEEAIMQGTAEDGEPGTVCMVLQKGYKMDNTVLRHAMVKVVPD
jgi:molecular chaperone GrpE